ncbi:hypothetical protein [Sporomusa acidovorans]|uniref:hypothetical protein n=1 Tax=Sporomusa acidovorans TaxID=112900 RepID=UPI00087ED75A|nr:hypothetical protein [Sporomusa acidovorans]OZC18936.1 hypothetical protein SPACI_30220 [Sporomusa acidovorans DSM 3132]SDD69665.1 hypothetical protein SAMN04488499_1003110 [Sporomusa acidovorans]
MNLFLVRGRLLRMIADYYALEKIRNLERTLTYVERKLNQPRLVFKLRQEIVQRKADAALVAAMIRLMPKEKQEFVRLRYLKKMPLVFVAPKLYISPKVAGVWNAEILERLYALREGIVGDFILSPQALCAVESYLNTILDFFLTEGMKYADPAYIRQLETRRASLFQLRLYMEQYLEKVNAQERQLLLCWCNDPCLTYVELAGRFYVSESTAGRYVMRFKGAMFIFWEGLCKLTTEK